MLTRRAFLAGLSAPVLSAPMQGPILSPDIPTDGSCAMAFSGGVFHVERGWIMFYLANFNRVAYALSDDGLIWRKPTNNVIFEQGNLDSFSVAQEPSGRGWCMTASARSGGPLRLLTSPDGLTWQEQAVMPWAGDRTTLWWNPVKGCWTFNVRAGGGTGGDPRRIDRVESDSFIPKKWDIHRWLEAEPGDGPGDGGPAQLYALDVVPDGRRLVGLFTIWRGIQEGRPKLNDVCLGFSTDGGDTWQRQFQPVLTRSETPGAWNYGNVQSCSGGLVRLSPWHCRLYASGRDGTDGGNGRCSMGYRDILL